MSRRILASLIGALVVAATVAPLVEAQRLPPHRFFGRVTQNNAPVAVGTRVEALIGTTSCGVGQTTSDGNYVVDIDSSTSKPGCGTDGAAITFRVGNGTANERPTYRTGGYERLDLTVASAQPFTVAGLNLEENRPCIPERGQTRCDATRELLWNGDAAAWAARGVTDPDARFEETIGIRVVAGDPAVIRNIARILGWQYLQVTQVRFVGEEYVEITNLGGAPQPMNGWQLRSPQRNQSFTFPDDFVMTAGLVCRVYSGPAPAGSCGDRQFSFGASDVWPDNAGRVWLLFAPLELTAADTLYSADPAAQPVIPNLQGVQ